MRGRINSESNVVLRFNLFISKVSAVDIEAVLYLARSIRLRPQYLIFICHSSQKNNSDVQDRLHGKLILSRFRLVFRQGY